MTSFKQPKVVRLGNSLDREIQDRLVDACRCNADEVCGFITKKEDIVFIPNSHREPHWNFYMAIEDIQEALTEVCKVNGDSVIGVFHTHPNDVPWPTDGDIAGWPNPDLGWFYWIATNHEVIEWGRGR